MLAGSADAAIYIVGDPAGAWSPVKGIEMKEVDGGYKWTGTIASDKWFAFATQLLDKEDWDTFNSTYRLNPSVNNTVAAPGEFGLILGGKDNSFKGCGAEVTFFIKETDGAYTLTVSSESDVPVVPDDPVEEKWGVVGQFNNWGETPDFAMTEIRPGVWKATMYDFSGEFKFRANSDWSHNYGPAEEALIEADGVFPIGETNSNFKIEEEVEEVILELDLNNMTLTVDGLTPSMLALCGSFIDWDFEWSYLFQEVDDDVYMLYLDGVEKDWRFKITDKDWTEYYTTGVTDMKSGEMYPFVDRDAGNMGVDNDYTEVSMFFDLEENIFWFQGEVSTSVASMEIANGKARYFNIQGVEVTNPSDGIFIRVINGKSEKITVK